MATQLCTTVIITQQQTKTKSQQVSHQPYSPDCTTTFDINKYYIYICGTVVVNPIKPYSTSIDEIMFRKVKLSSTL